MSVSVKIQQYLIDSIKRRQEQIKIHEQEIQRLKNLTYTLKPHQINKLIGEEENHIKNYKKDIRNCEKALKDEFFIYSEAFRYLENQDHTWILADAYFKIILFSESKIDPKSYPAIKDITPDMIDSYAKIKHDLTERFRLLNYKEENIREILKHLFVEELRIPRSAKKVVKKIKIATGNETTEIKNLNHFIFSTEIM